MSGDLNPNLGELEGSLEHPYIAFQPDMKFWPPSATSGPSEDGRDEGHDGVIVSCGYSVARKLMVSASADHTMKVWDAQNGEVLRTLIGHQDSVNGCAFDQDGHRVVSGSSDRTLRVWDSDSGELQSILEHSASVNGCAFSPDGNRIVSASSDHTLIIWDAQKAQSLYTLKRVAVWGQLKDENGVPSLNNDGKPEVGETDVKIDGHQNAVNDCAFSSDGKLILSASDDGTLKLWDAEAGELLKTFRDRGQSGAIKSCAFSCDDSSIVSASSDSTLTVWDVEQGRVLQQFKRKATVGGDLDHYHALTNGHSGEVNDCAFSPDGKLIVSVSSDCTLKVWDVSSQRCKATFYDDGGMNCCLIEGDLIVAGGERGVYFLRLVR